MANKMRLSAHSEIDRDVRELFMKLNRMHISYLTVAQRKALLKKAAKPVIKAAKNAAPVDTGGLRNSIGVIPGMSDVTAVYVGPRYTGGKNRTHKWGGNHAHLTEYGSRKWNSPHKGWFRRSVMSSRREAFQVLKELVEAEFTKFRNRYGFTKRA